MSSTNFTAVVHNIVSQMLLAIKADTVVEQTLAALKEKTETAPDGRKVVIALANTLESHIKSMVDSGDLVPGQDYDFDFSNVLKKALRGTLRYTTSSHRGTKDHFVFQMPGVSPPRGATVGDPLPVQAEALYRKVERMIDSLTLDLPGSPIDYIMHRLEEAGVRVGELTGRSYTFDKNGTLGVRKAAAKNKNNLVNGFNGGTLDVLILNSSGATGLSIHASEKFPDQRPRRMIVAQPELNIDTEIQKYGRIFRTGQVAKPSYVMMMTDLASEFRPVAVLMKKMASLNAATTANSESHNTLKNIPDMMNKYGDEIMRGYPGSADSRRYSL